MIKKKLRKWYPTEEKETKAVLVVKTEDGKEFVLTGNSGHAYLEPYEKSCDIKGDVKI